MLEGLNSIRANGIGFQYFESGPAEGPLVLCLHGFPDTAQSWRHLLPTLGDAGFRAVAPYMRGYAPSEFAPDGNYQVAVLAQDVAELISALGAERAYVVGHDWGALAAHAAAVLQPERIMKLVTMAVPHRMASLSLMSNYAQQKRSWYTFLFQLPIAEGLVAANDFSFLEQLWKDWSPGYCLEPSEREVLKKCFRTPGVVAAALDYYRATFQPERQSSGLAEAQARALAETISVDTLYFHGEQDGCMGVECCQGLESAFSGELRQVILKEAGHFLHLEDPQRVSKEVLAFFA